MACSGNILQSPAEGLTIRKVIHYSLAVVDKKFTKAGPYTGKSRVWGHCLPSGKIEIDPRLEAQDYCDTLIHELLHRELWSLSEECVNETAKIIADQLFLSGFRRIAK